MPTFAESLKSGRFLVTAELNPPKGTDLGELLRKAESLRDWVDAFNLTDSASAIMTMSPLGAAKALIDHGFEPIVQVTGRDRNRIAIQGDLLAGAALGVHTIVCMGGDPPGAGDHPDAKPVFDFDTLSLLRAAKALNNGADFMGKALKGSPQYCIGAVANPGAPDLDKEIARMGEKVDEGAEFFQTQAVYDPEAFAKFMERAKAFGKPVLAGFIVLKSGDMARRLNATLPGVSVPEPIIAELDAAADKAAKSVEIAGRVIAAVKPLCQGVHIMAIGWESRIPAILQAAGIPKRS
ncbi:MAG TPA: methylenetetrahydrofolate reductase [Dehalococcoidia bacterium]|nr:methylenetetrahydrofolate reductase [Dehalococcoidia bacterium]